MTHETVTNGAQSSLSARFARVIGRPARRRRAVRGVLWLRLVALLTLLVPSLAVMPAHADVNDQAAQEEDILAPDGSVVGRFFRETGGGNGLGYDVREPFFSAFNAMGGVTSVGYPVSNVFTGIDGCSYQDFQISLLQACPNQPVQRANTFQILQDAGVDGVLQQKGIGSGENDNAKTYDDAVKVRLAWLEDSAIKDAFVNQCGNGSVDAAIQACGLPMGHPRPQGPFISQRFQRIAFLKWLADGPGGIHAGDVTSSLGGDLLKDTTVLSGTVTQPHAISETTQAGTVSFTAKSGGNGGAGNTGGTGGAGGASTPTPVPAATAAPTVAPTTAPATQSRTTPLQFGFQADLFDTSKRAQAINLVQGAGFGWTKQQLVWSQYEISQSDCAAASSNCLQQTVNGRPKYFKKDWIGYLDAVVADVSTSGLNLMLSVVHAPAFYAAPGGNAPSDPQMLGDWVQFLATRYKGKVKAVEPWNEQNLAWEWGGSRLWPNAPGSPPQGVVDFVQLQKAAFNGIKAGDPNITVVLPALTPTGLAECWLNTDVRSAGFCLDQAKTAIDDRLYLDFVFQVNGGEIKNYYDVLGVHPSGYNNPPDDTPDHKTVPSTSFKGHGSFYIYRYKQLHDVQLKYGDNKPMWFTEVGWSVTQQSVPGYEYGMDNTEAARGKYFARLFEQVQNEAPYVTNVFIWNLNFRTLVSPPDEKYGFGLINSDGSPTPAYTCVADFVKSGNKITRPDCKS